MTIPEILEAFDKTFRPTWKRDISKNEIVKLPGDFADWVHMMEDLKSFLISHLESYALSQKQELTRGAMEKVEPCSRSCETSGELCSDQTITALREYFEKEGVLVKEE